MRKIRWTFGWMILCGGAITANELETNKELVRQFTEVLNAAEWDGLEPLMSEDFERHSQATNDTPEITSRQQFVQMQQRFAAAIPDQAVTIHFLVAEGDRVAAYATYSGTQSEPMGEIPASDKSVELKFLAIFRIEANKIAEMWVEWDNLAFLSQLGLFPSPCEE